jgi:hypothetical protein
MCDAPLKTVEGAPCWLSGDFGYVILSKVAALPEDILVDEFPLSATVMQMQGRIPRLKA